jgi:hypothetical protein
MQAAENACADDALSLEANQSRVQFVFFLKPL